ncbi:MAG: hypothetical protein ACJ756_12590 [Solirubrobacterales bacterium]
MGRKAVLIAVALLLALPACAAAKDRIVITGPVLVGPTETVGNVVAFDGNVTIRGRVTSDVVAFNGDVRVPGGRVGGDVTALNGQIVLAPRAVVGGDVNWRDTRPVIPPGADVGGSVDEFQWDVSPWSGFAWALLLWLAETVSALVLGLILIALWPRGFEALAAAWRRSPGPVAGWGALLLIGLPIVAVIALVTLVGIPLGIGLLLALIPLWAVGYVAGTFVLGRLILRDAGRFVAFLLGLLIVQVLALIPFVNALVAIVVVAIGLGTLIVAAWRANRPEAPGGARAGVAAGT